MKYFFLGCLTMILVLAATLALSAIADDTVLHLPNTNDRPEYSCAWCLCTQVYHGHFPNGELSDCGTVRTGTTEDLAAFISAAQGPAIAIPHQCSFGGYTDRIGEHCQ